MLEKIKKMIPRVSTVRNTDFYEFGVKLYHAKYTALTVSIFKKVYIVWIRDLKVEKI